MSQQENTFDETQARQCVQQCRYFGWWQADFVSTEIPICRNPKVFSIYKQEHYNKDNLADFVMMAEHEASQKWLWRNRGINAEIAFGLICKLQRFEHRLSLKQRILRLFGKTV